MNCPHCNKVIVVKLMKDSNVGQSQASNGDISDLAELLDAIDDSQLDGQALDFVTQTRERFKKYKGKTIMSDKQLAWLRKLANPDEEEWQ